MADSRRESVASHHGVPNHFLRAALIRVQPVEDVVVHAGEAPYAGYEQVLVAVRPRGIGAKPCHLFAE